MKIVIAKATKEDYSGIVSVFGEVSYLHANNLTWKFKKMAPEFLLKKEEFVSMLSDDNSLMLVAKLENQVVGYLKALNKTIINDGFFQDRNFVFIDDLGIKNGFEKQGIGTLLMSELETWAKSKNASEIELNVWSFNTNAIIFYEKNNFEAINQRMRKVL